MKGDVPDPRRAIRAMSSAMTEKLENILSEQEKQTAGVEEIKAMQVQLSDRLSQLEAKISQAK